MIVAMVVLCFFCACGQQIIDEEAIKTEINSVMFDSKRAWNEGDIEKYMESYLESSSLRFAGNGDVSYGWKDVLERYKRSYPDRTAMGKLTFSDIDITVVSEDAAVVFGRWKLERAEDERSGLYTLLFRKTDDGWRIVHDHSSSAKQ